jgi:hypothetical protein
MQIIIFTRYPMPGKVKTRLIPAIGPKKASRLQKLMTEHIVEQAMEFCNKQNKSKLSISVYGTGGNIKDFKAWLGPEVDYQLQPQGELGFRMGMIFRNACKFKKKPVVLIGSDLPGLTFEIFQQAFEALEKNDLVLGPSTDGGYYLIGMKVFYPELFQNIEWGTKNVYKKTIDVVEKVGLEFKELPVLHDIDRAEDLEILRTHPKWEKIFSTVPLLSIIIPALNEEKMLASTLKRVYHAQSIDVIVVDGGSRDNTYAIARQSGARVLKETGGRSAQQNEGAAQAKGELLLFLHADTLLPNDYDQMIRTALASPKIVGGAFRFKTDNHGKKLKIVELFANLRSYWLRLPYGDQGLFMEKRVFNEIGGFAPVSIMEDFDLVLRLRRRGRLVLLNHAAITSARRWQEHGVLRTSIINQMMILGFFAGLPSTKLREIYKVNKTSRPKL